MTCVLIATNEPVLAKGLESILTAGGLEVAAVCGDILELFERLRRHRPEVAIIDPPILPDPGVLPDLRRFAPACRFVLWPRRGNSMSPAEFVEAINLAAVFAPPDTAPAEVVYLTCNPTERNLISLLGYGLTNQEIAALTGSREPAVQKLLKNLADRLGAEDRCELALYGLSTLKEGPGTPDPSIQEHS
jgi:DNA-binding NarL/FixJ family response regulator